MTDRPVDEIRPGDRVYLSAGRGDNLSPFSKGDIVTVSTVGADGSVGANSFNLTFRGYKPLRILQPGDVIPVGATMALVRADGSLSNTGANSFAVEAKNDLVNRVILSMPTPEPTREEQREKLVEARQVAKLAVKDAMYQADSCLVDAVRVFCEALDALEKFDAENPS